MDDLSRSALIRGITAFVVIVVAGTTLVYAAGRVGSKSTGEGAPTGPPPTSVPSSPVVTTPEAWLAWVPGGVPEDFGASLTAIPAVTNTTTAAADIAWMTGSTNGAGVAIDTPTAPYMIPIDTTGVDLRSFPSFLPQPERGQVAELQPGQGILSESEAQLRGLRRGATLTFDGSVDIKVVGTLPDAMMGGYELLVDRATGQQLGVTHDRYVLFHVAPNATITAQELAQKMVQYLPLGVPHPVVEVRSPGETPYLRANDGELPPVLLKRRFGEFTAYPDPAAPGLIRIDPAWIQDHITSTSLPVLGTVTCNERILGLLRSAMTRLQTMGHAADVAGVGPCFVATASPTDPEGPLTARPFGAAIVLNPATNKPGDPPEQSSELVQAMARSGFGWAGTDAFPQGALFRFRGRTSIQD
ncbi:MAG TPA: hypothetical protein VK646_11045 [Actinomycetota bacterium]|nr:hypothetical protein [Actinomycetota bacterium]